MGEFFRHISTSPSWGTTSTLSLEGFWWTIKAFPDRRSLPSGLILSVIRQLPGKALAPVRVARSLHIDCLRGIPMLLTLLLIYGGLGTL